MKNIKNFEDFMGDTLLNENLLCEGIIPNYIKKSVKLTMDHNDGVDFSEDSYIKFKRNGLTVFSIFKRTPLPDGVKNYRDNDDDGNPFIYALKGVDGWKFDITENDAKSYIRRFLNICNSIDKKYDVLIMAPSNNSLNRRFMSIIYKIIGANVKIEDYFLKIQKSDVLYNLDTDMIENDFPTESSQNFIEKDMKRELNLMGMNFEAKKFKKYLKYVKSVVTINNNYSVADSAELFNGKSVLVLDDVFSSGKTVSDCVKCIRDFEPTKVDVITLLSRKIKSKKKIK